MLFDWDEEKAGSNISRRGITFEDASTVFGDPLALTVPDPEHSVGEERMITFGLTLAGQHVVVAHMDRNATIRIISARRMTAREKRIYENHA